MLIYHDHAMPSPSQQVASKLIGNEMKGRRTGYMAADEGVEDLHLLYLPAELEAFISSGPTFDYQSQLHQEARQAITHLSSSFTDPATAVAVGGAARATAFAPAAAEGFTSPRPAANLNDHLASGSVSTSSHIGQGTDGGSGALTPNGNGSNTSGGPPASKRVWAAQRAVADASSDALLSMARNSFTAASTLSSSPGAPFGTSPHLGQLLSTDAALDEEEPVPRQHQESQQQVGGGRSVARRAKD